MIEGGYLFKVGIDLMDLKKTHKQTWIILGEIWLNHIDNACKTLKMKKALRCIH